MRSKKRDNGLGNTLKLMRIPFSYFLLPVFLFAVSEVREADFYNLIISFIVLHIFIYPASNGYNSFVDKDEDSIGGLRKPPEATKDLFYLSMIFDILGISLALLISFDFFAGVILYMLASRAYSARHIRLKRFPVIGFFTVILFQGGFTFLIVYNAVDVKSFSFTWPDYLLLIISSLLIAGVYPMTQIYQHAADKKDGVTTLSMKLGIRGTFAFSSLMFLIASGFFLYYHSINDTLIYFWFYLIFLSPVLIYFTNWFLKVYKNESNADFDHTMRLNLIASSCLNVYFILKILLNNNII
jgi:1,4-dihydroxy-2-naphthoate polyprenyltransferase